MKTLGRVFLAHGNFVVSRGTEDNKPRKPSGECRWVSDEFELKVTASTEKPVWRTDKPPPYVTVLTRVRGGHFVCGFQNRDGVWQLDRLNEFKVLEWRKLDE